MFSLKSKGRLVEFRQPVVMGIINTTPDSFYAGSRKTAVDDVLRQAEKLLQNGATMIDIGGQSTRPGSVRVPEEEELRRVLPPVEALLKRFPEILLSVDTFYASVARRTIVAGAFLINDVSAGTVDAQLIPTVAELQVPYVLMHLPQTLDSISTPPDYENVVTSVFDFFAVKLKEITAAGIHDVILDIGFGFGKTAANNFALLKHLSYFKLFQKPILLGLSRKGTIYKTLGVTAAESLNGTTVLNTVGLLNGAAILRVHDANEAAEAVTLINALEKSEP